MCTFALAVYYYSDLYCLFRVWAPPPKIDTQLASFSKKYFFTTALLALVTTSGFFIAMFPFDNLCKLSEEKEYSGTFEVKFGDDTTGKLSFDSPIPIYQYCNQNLLETSDYPLLLNEYNWFTSAQSDLRMSEIDDMHQHFEALQA